MSEFESIPVRGLHVSIRDVGDVCRWMVIFSAAVEGFRAARDDREDELALSDAEDGTEEMVCDAEVTCISGMLQIQQATRNHPGIPKGVSDEFNEAVEYASFMLPDSYRIASAAVGLLTE